MRGTRAIQAGEPAIFQVIRGVCAVGGDEGAFGVSVVLTGLTWGQRMLPGVDVHHQHRSSFRLEGLELKA